MATKAKTTKTQDVTTQKTFKAGFTKLFNSVDRFEDQMGSCGTLIVEASNQGKLKEWLNPLLWNLVKGRTPNFDQKRAAVYSLVYDNTDEKFGIRKNKGKGTGFQVASITKSTATKGKSAPKTLVKNIMQGMKLVTAVDMSSEQRAELLELFGVVLDAAEIVCVEALNKSSELTASEVLKRESAKTEATLAA